jgi:hypothetical protein
MQLTLATDIEEDSSAKTVRVNVKKLEKCCEKKS